MVFAPCLTVTVRLNRVAWAAVCARSFAPGEASVTTTNPATELLRLKLSTRRLPLRETFGLLETWIAGMSAMVGGWTGGGWGAGVVLGDDDDGVSLRVAFAESVIGTPLAVMLRL